MCACDPGWTCERCAADQERRAEEARPEDRDTPQGAEKPQEVERWPV
jgi:hypothetical protein